MRRSALSVGLLLLGASLLPAQTDDATWFWDKPIRDFAFDGLVSVNAAELRPIVRPYIGRPLTAALFQEIQDRLYALNYFDLLEGEAVAGDDTRSSVIVRFQVTERPTVASVQIRGNRRLGTPAILEAILVKRGDMLSEANVNVDVESIKRLYLEKGYTKVQVTGHQEPNTTKNTVDVVFEIVEGPQTKIRSVRFSGNSFASESTLRRLMKTKSQSLLSSGDFQESVFEEDKQAILDYYGQNGFIDAKIVKADQVYTDDETGERTNLDITIYVEEGQQFTFGGLTVTGNELYSTEELQDLVRMRAGRPVNTQQLHAAILRIQDRYWSDGYLETQFDSEVARDTAAGVATYALTIQEGGRVHIENIILSGNEKTQDFVILREMPIEEGDIFSAAKIRQGNYNLLNLQYFSSVQLDYAPGSARGLADLVITLEEQSTASFNFGVNFSGDSPISGKVGWSETNLLGRGLKISVDAELSNVLQSLALSLQEPWLFGKRWSGGVSLSASHDLVTSVPQDILGPVFTDQQYGSGLAVPDPYDGHYVYSSGDDAGKPFDWSALQPEDYDTQAEVDNIVSENGLVTDYQYADSAVPAAYTMSYDKFAFALGLRTGVRIPTNVGVFRVDPYFNSSLDYKQYDDTVYRPFRREDREGLRKWLFVNTLGLSLAWDKRDIPISPQQGFYLGQSVASVGGVLLGWKHYIRTLTTLEGYITPLSIPVSDNYTFKVTLAAHTSLSFLLPQWHYDRATNTWIVSRVNETSDLIYIDGMTNARGWRGVLPGAALWESQFEIRLPISEQLLWWTFFFDVAGKWNQPSDMATMGIEDFYFSFGAGFRLIHPQFPIRVYLAKGFRIDNGVQWKPGNFDLGKLSIDFVISLGGLTF